MRPSVCIVIVNWNQLNLTLECLDSLSKINYDNFNIIVVDNNSRNDPTLEIKERFPDVVVLVQSENRGFTGGNNVGISYALEQGVSYILLLNNDTIVDKNFLGPLVKKLENNSESIGVVTSKIYYLDKPSTIWAMGGKTNFWLGSSKSFLQGTKDDGQFTTDIEVDYATGCCMLFSVEQVKKNGVLDDRYFAYFEDVDYCFRIKRTGLKIYVVANSKIWHVAGGSSYSKGGLSPFVLFLNIRNSIWFFRQYSKLPQAVLTFFTMSFRFLIYLSYFLTFGKLDKFHTTVKGIKEGISLKIK